ncbi:roadblock/LC7 domain-containing protein [Streptomyces sp. NPDC058417]|uniref:roadblock/LC7 domain-containing protein n=1 Tax=unclassified Streptomyces TaxID=2593676 RepID=UPI0036618E72
MNSTHSNPLGWLLDERIGSLNGVRAAVLLTADALLHSRTSVTSQEAAEKLAAIGGTLHGAARTYTGESGVGEVRQVLVEAERGLCVIARIGENMLVLVETGTEDVDIALITQQVVVLGASVSEELRALARVPAGERPQP